MCIAERTGGGQPGRADFDGKSGPVIGSSRQPAGRAFFATSTAETFFTMKNMKGMKKNLKVFD
jgi:hypothetical protein